MPKPKSGEAVDWDAVLKDAPPIIWRNRWDHYADRYGLPYTRGTLQNFDYRGMGPERVVHGNRVGYTKEILIKWLQRTDGTMPQPISQEEAVAKSEIVDERRKELLEIPFDKLRVLYRHTTGIKGTQVLDLNKPQLADGILRHELIVHQPPKAA
ncbi:MAG: hypothetical protein LLF89_10210 [Spirochaetaceae bacterium]|nr:hypothetical protein [Spirochaetaceae bacterium]